MKPVIFALWVCLGVYFEVIFGFDLSENEIDHHEGHNHPNLKSPASELPHELNILKLRNVSHKDPGVSLVDGPISQFPAYKFRLPYENIPLPNSSVITKNFNVSNGFTVVFLYRQQRNNVGTLLSVNSPGRLTPWFQLVSNSRTGTLLLKYRLENSNKPRQIEWSLPRHHKKSPLAAWIWTSVSVDYSDGVVRLDVDCAPSVFEMISSENSKEDKIGIPTDALVYFRQEPGRKKKFLGSIQVAKVLPYVTHKRLWSCMEISPNLLPEFRKPLL
ncbi:kielin/chordin-like protein [Cylas formicarius]|uniref:kielin/chordin-like protein n=1 Tax=Cylas formicarius TaxID=197179 RepID=UPI002958A614|nr:kielin/chordin-like protein [Cylas formicarius]